MSILVYNYKQLTECIKEVEQIEVRLTKNEGLTREHEEEKEQQPPKPRPTTTTAALQERLQKQLKLSEF